MLKQISLVALCASMILPSIAMEQSMFPGAMRPLGASGAAVGIIGTMVYADHYYANAIEYKKLENEREEKRKKEMTEKEEAHNKKILAEQKAHAQQLVRHLKIHYKEEVNAINAGNINNQKQIFATIIKRKQTNPISRFADYRTNLEHDKQQLELVEPLMSPEEKTEHAALSANSKKFHARSIIV